MDEDVIDDIAYEFSKQLEFIDDVRIHPRLREYRYNQCLDDIYLMAKVIHRWSPKYDLRYFYKAAGFPEPYPHHEME